CSRKNIVSKTPRFDVRYASIPDIHDLIRTGCEICTGKTDLAFSNSKITQLAMPCPACIAAKNGFENYNPVDVRMYEVHLITFHGLER
ncbi:MAG: hypothetical protein ACHQ1H_08240, partial [Nitrososphaerales archaeon]